jgi:hypothetical protein
MAGRVVIGYDGSESCDITMCRRGESNTDNPRFGQ